MKSHFYNLSLVLLLAGYAGGNVSVANDDDNTVGNPAAAVTVSFDEVVEQIRQHTSWQILDARSKQQGAAFSYRFKLMNSSGQVRIFFIDPKNPNLGHLEQ